MKHLKRKEVLPLIFCLLCLGASIAACIAASARAAKRKNFILSQILPHLSFQVKLKKRMPDFPPPGKPPLPPYPYMAGRWPLFIPATQNPS